MEGAQGQPLELRKGRHHHRVQAGRLLVTKAVGIRRPLASCCVSYRATAGGPASAKDKKVKEEEAEEEVEERKKEIERERGGGREERGNS